MPKYRLPPPLSRRKIWVGRAKKGALALGGLIVAGVIAASITTDRVDSLAESVADLFSPADKKPTIPVRVTHQLYAETQRANIWESPPTMYPQGRRYILDHFRAFDPRRPHRYLIPRAPVLPPAELVDALPLYAGNRITLIGTVHAVNVGTSSPGTSHLRLPGHKGRVTVPNLTYIAQIGLPGSPGPLVYCLFTEASVHRLRPGQWIVAIGVPIAGGTIKLVNGHLTPGAYMVGAGVRPVTGPRPIIRFVRRLEERERRQRRRAADRG